VWLQTGFELKIGFIDHFNTRLVTTLNYNAIADPHTLQISTAHAKSSVCFVFTSGSLVTATNSRDSSASALTSLPAGSQLHDKVFSSQTPLQLTAASSSNSHCDWRSVSKSQIFITLWQLWSCFVGRPLWREDGPVFCICCWPCQRSLSRVQVPWYSRPYFTLRFETSLFVATYDSQGHGGGIRPRLQTDWLTTAWLVSTLYNPLARTAQKTPFPTVSLLLRVNSLLWETIRFAVAA
jgi:hypothetical protein